MWNISVVCKRKRIDHPMSLLDLASKQGGQYVHCIFDMGRTSWPVFQMFSKPGAEIFLYLMTGWVMCTAGRTITGILPFAEAYAQACQMMPTPVASNAPINRDISGYFARIFYTLKGTKEV